VSLAQQHSVFAKGGGPMLPVEEPEGIVAPMTALPDRRPPPAS
jgi:hypothetical protein